MRPGDVVTCTCCGSQARAQWTPLDRPRQEGYPLLLTWTHGPHPRTHVTHEAPERCIWCHERCQALGDDAPPLYRPAPGAEPGELVVAHTERPAGNVPGNIPASSAGEGPGATPEADAPEADPAGLDGRPSRPRSPLERFEELAEAFRRATGMLAPGKDQAAAACGSPSDQERAAAWRSWCRARGEHTPPKPAPKPRGQLSLFG